MSATSDGDETCVYQFDFGVRLGLVFIVEMACLSACAVGVLLAYIGVCLATSPIFLS